MQIKRVANIIDSALEKGFSRKFDNGLHSYPPHTCQNILPNMLLESEEVRTKYNKKKLARGSVKKKIDDSGDKKIEK